MLRLFQGYTRLLHAIIGRSDIVNAKIHHEINEMNGYAGFDTINRTAKFIFLFTCSFKKSNIYFMTSLFEPWCGRVLLKRRHY
jgi:hypothetical protein